MRRPDRPEPTPPGGRRGDTGLTCAIHDPEKGPGWLGGPERSSTGQDRRCGVMHGHGGSWAPFRRRDRGSSGRLRSKTSRRETRRWRSPQGRAPLLCSDPARTPGPLHLRASSILHTELRPGAPGACSLVDDGRCSTWFIMSSSSTS